MSNERIFKYRKIYSFPISIPGLFKSIIYKWTLLQFHQFNRSRFLAQTQQTICKFDSNLTNIYILLTFNNCPRSELLFSIFSQVKINIEYRTWKGQWSNESWRASPLSNIEKTSLAFFSLLYNSYHQLTYTRALIDWTCA